MNMISELIVMLTRNDRTVDNACDLFDEGKRSSAQYWGIKETGLPPEQMKNLCGRIRDAGKTPVMEVVAYCEKECMEGAQRALECGCEILMGTMYYDSVNALCRESGIRYMPFVGKVSGRPSILEGTEEDMIAEARMLLEKGVFGFDLLGYRFTGDAPMLNARFTGAVNAPVCIAGSINSFRRLAEIRDAAPWAFTIGGAFFERRFGEGFCEQIDRVVAYMRNGKREEFAEDAVSL